MRDYDEDSGFYQADYRDPLIILEGYLQNLGKKWNFRYFYGFIADLEKMTFVKYDSQENQIAKSKEFTIKFKDTYLKNNKSKEFREVYLLLACLIEKAMEEFIIG